MYKRYCLNPPGYLVQPLLCFIEGVSLPLEARKEFVAERNLLTWLNPNNSTEIIALWGRGASKITKKVLTYFMDGPNAMMVDSPPYS